MGVGGGFAVAILTTIEAANRFAAADGGGGELFFLFALRLLPACICVTNYKHITTQQNTQNNTKQSRTR